MQIKTKTVSWHTADSKPVKQKVNGTVMLPPLVFPGLRPRAYLRVEYLKASFATLLANISLGWNGLPGTNTNLLQIFINSPFSIPWSGVRVQWKKVKKFCGFQLVVFPPKTDQRILVYQIEVPH